MIKLKDLIKEIEDDVIILSREEEDRGFELLKKRFIPKLVEIFSGSRQEDEEAYDMYLQETMGNLIKYRRTQNHVVYKSYIEGGGPIYFFIEKQINYPKERLDEPQSKARIEIFIGYIQARQDNGWDKKAWKIEDVMNGIIKFEK